MKTDYVKLGRIPKSVERKLDVDFGEGIFVYVNDERLNEFTKEYPTSYLVKLEEASKILKHADFASYDGKDRLYLFKEYVKEAHFYKVVLELERNGEFYFRALYPYKEERFLSQKADAKIVSLGP
ncbi:MAG: hypothetical protein LKF75_04245 [Bacilli bacterium]|nr:hypothetical protein [Bacilli bacterium]MCH4210345.1 hypothetical protein [Bacilli bacterium]MCH4228885.1 hypothetical protein [Bacilli bacterium]MCH4277971.1 hypothetical protein [Bacilli bacterium]MCI2054765.1 hypothetical protein [Bacilli bacterium]